MGCTYSYAKKVGSSAEKKNPDPTSSATNMHFIISEKI
jgi:hypothetical protein